MQTISGPDGASQITQYTVPSVGAIQIAVSNVGRRYLLIGNNGSATVYLGGTAAVSNTTDANAGFPIFSGTTLSTPIKGDIYAIAATGTVDVRVIEGI